MGKLIIDTNNDFLVRQSKSLLIIETNELFQFNSMEFVDINLSASDGVDFVLHSQCYSFCQRICNFDTSESVFNYSYIFKKTSLCQDVALLGFNN